MVEAVARGNGEDLSAIIRPHIQRPKDYPLRATYFWRSISLFAVSDQENEMRVPDVEIKRVSALTTIGDYLDGGIELRSFCSSGMGHSHVVNLSALVERYGPDTPIDHALKISLICPVCGSAGGGIEIRKKDPAT